MALLKIYTLPAAILRQKAKPNGEVTAETRKIFDDMLETMYESDGIGLAAPQVGISKKLLVIDTQDTDREKSKKYKELFPLYMADLEIIEKSELMVDSPEACLSVPGVSVDVKRHARIKIRYRDYNNKIQEMDIDDFLAIVIQHENDHLEGITLLDRVSSLKRSMLFKKMEKFKRNQNIT